MEPKEAIDPAAFFSVDMRVGEITEVETFPEARKTAWKLTVDFGPEIGVKHTSAQVTNYSRDELLGRKIVGVVNIGTKKIAGFTSEFLVLGAMDADTVLLLNPDMPAKPGHHIA